MLRRNRFRPFRGAVAWNYLPASFMSSKPCHHSSPVLSFGGHHIVRRCITRTARSFDSAIQRKSGLAGLYFGGDRVPSPFSSLLRTVSEIFLWRNEYWCAKCDFLEAPQNVVSRLCVCWQPFFPNQADARSAPLTIR